MHTIRTHLVALRAIIIATVVLGVAYTAAVTAVAQLTMPSQSNGALVEQDGEVVGSTLIGQCWLDESGAPLPAFFQGRPSAGGCDGSASGGSNQGPESADLIAAIEERRTQIAAFEGVAPEAIPVDALTASASGLDPHISPEYALLQVPRIAREHGLDESAVMQLVTSMIESRDLGFLGEERVNVLELNLALESLGGR